MDAEIFSWNALHRRRHQVDDETIALDAIKQVGIGGNYLGQRHTRRHMKDVWRPRLLDRSMWDAWVASGREGAYEKATALVEQLLAEHEVRAARRRGQRDAGAHRRRGRGCRGCSSTYMGASSLRRHGRRAYRSKQ